MNRKTENGTPSKGKPFAKRDCIIAAKVTKEQKSKIEKTASSCGMTVSDFVLARCYGYEPSQRLTQDELSMLSGLAGYRSDLLNYTSALHGMKPSQRWQMFDSLPFMYGWTKELGREYENCHAIIEKLTMANKVPGNSSRVRHNKEEQ